MKYLFLLLFFGTLFCVSCSSGSNGEPNVTKDEKIDSKILDDGKEDNSSYKDACSSLKMPSGSELYYCFKDFHVNTEPDNIIYFLHGVNGKASDMMPFVSSQSSFYDLIRATDYKTPVVVSLSFGPMNLIPSEPSGSNPKSVSEILDYAIPKIERDALKYHYAKDQPPKRHLIGMSLGGYNALNLSSFRPTYFKTVMALCPALLNINPFSPVEVEEYIRRNSNHVDPKLVYGMISSLKEKLVTEANWQSRNPIESAKNGIFDKTPIFVSIGSQDEYGFFEGSEVLKSILSKSNSYFQYSAISGPHCTFDPVSLENFFKIYVARSTTH